MGSSKKLLWVAVPSALGVTYYPISERELIEWVVLNWRSIKSFKNNYTEILIEYGENP